MSDWKTSRAALRLHSAAYDIETAWEDERPVTRAMCEQYHAAVDEALGADMPADKRAAEAARLRSWAERGVIPASGAKWAEYVATMLSAEKAPIGRPPVPVDRRDVKIVSVRVEGSARREKLRRLGRAWLERAIDDADDPHRGDSDSPSDAAD